MTEKEQIRPLTDKELIFAQEYLVCQNKAKAARKAGYPARSAKEQGHEVFNRPPVKAYLEEKLRQRVMSTDEAIKLVDDIANGNILDYYKPVKVVKVDKVKVPLQKLIDEIQEEIELEDEFALSVNLTGKELKRWETLQDKRRHLKIRYKLRLKRNPDAFEIRDGEPKLVTEQQLDINRLVKDKERGKVKKIKHGRGGVEVEMYDAKDATIQILKMNGQFDKSKLKPGEGGEGDDDTNDSEPTPIMFTKGCNGN